MPLRMPPRCDGLHGSLYLYERLPARPSTSASETASNKPNPSTTPTITTKIVIIGFAPRA